MLDFRSFPSLRIAIGYLVCGLLLVWLSEAILMRVDLGLLTSALKGSVFVLVTAPLLYWYVRLPWPAPPKAQDIHEQNRVAESLRESEARFRTLVESIPDAILINGGGRIVFCNPASLRLFGTDDPTQILGKTPFDLHASEYHEIIRQRIATQLATGKPVPGLEEEIIRMDGRRVPVYVTALPITNHGTGALLVVMHDLTERKRVEAKIHHLNLALEQRVRDRTIELEAANRELEAFSYSVSHDLRAPIRAINGFTKILSDEHGAHLPEEARAYLNEVGNAAQRMGQLVDDLLAFSRLSRLPLRRQPVDTGNLLESCLTEVLNMSQGRKIETKVGDLPACQADPSLLRQVWLNLLSNAVKYSGTRELAEIAIGSLTTPEGPAFFVKDNGVGFDMRYAHKLFGVFQRLHREEEFEGTGIGLALVQRIVHRHGGRVWAEAEPNKGAAFYFTLGRPLG